MINIATTTCTFHVNNQSGAPLTYSALDLSSGGNAQLFDPSDGSNVVYGGIGNLQVQPLPTYQECVTKIDSNIDILFLPIFLMVFFMVVGIMIVIFNFKNPWK